MIEPYPVAIVACGLTSVALVVLSVIPARSPMAKRLKKMERVSEKSVSARVVAIEKIVSKEGHSRLQRRLVEAGWYAVTPTAMVLRGMGGAGIGLAGGLLAMLAFGEGWLGVALAVFSALVGWRLPSIFLARAIAARKEDVQRELPDFLDMLANTVRAGLALNSAMVHAVNASHGALKEELTSMLSEVRLGRPRSDAFTAMAARVNEECTTIMVTAIVQAEKIGSNLSEMLVELAGETRDRRWLRAEERAARLPIKMILPMALFMIPSLYLMIFGPVIALLATQR
jgi:tight adherence protein C